MRTSRLTKWLIPLALLTHGCSNFFIDSVDDLRTRNKENIARIEAGMPRAQVEQLMGTEAAGGQLGDVLYGRVQHLEVKNPHRTETVTGNDGRRYEILFYYTDLRQRDDAITDDELTPVVLHDQRVAGVGYSYLGVRVPKYAEYR